jgi:hypothetical protein
LATHYLVRIADPVGVGIAQALPRAIVPRIWELATSVVVRGFWAVVAGTAIGASLHFVFIADSIGIGIVEAIAIAVQFRGIGPHARPVVICGRGAVIAGHRIGASRNFELIANPVRVGICQAFTPARVARRCVGARSGFRGGCIVIACIHVLTPLDFIRIAHPITVAVGKAPTRAIEAGLWVKAVR